MQRERVDRIHVAKNSVQWHNVRNEFSGFHKSKTFADQLSDS
jgi:hypothetical protein